MITIEKIKNSPFARNSLILFSGSMLANVLAYVFHVVVGRLVNVETYGEVNSLTSLSNIISVPAAALTMIATRFSSASKAKNDMSSSLMLFKYLNKRVLKYGMPLFIVAIILTPLVKNFLKIESFSAILILWMFMFLSFFASINGGIISGWQKFQSSSITAIIGGLAKLIFVVILISLGFGLNGIIGSFLLGGIATYASTFFFLKFIFKRNKINDRQKSEKDVIDFASLKRYIIPAFMGNFAITILGNADMVLAKHNLSPEIAGQYGALNIVGKIIFFATGVIATVLFAMAAEKEHQKKNSLKTFFYASSLTMAVSLVALIFYFSFPKIILSFLFGNKYESVASYLGWFGILAVIFSFANLIIQYLLSIQKTKFIFSTILISLISIILILIWGKSIFAIIGLMALCQIIVIILSLFFIAKNKSYE